MTEKSCCLEVKEWEVREWEPKPNFDSKTKKKTPILKIGGKNNLKFKKIVINYPTELKGKNLEQKLCNPINNNGGKMPQDLTVLLSLQTRDIILQKKE